MEGAAVVGQEVTLLERDGVSELAADLRLLADETRLRILDFLADGEQCVCHITEALDLSQPLASYHLAVLRDAGLVNDRRDSRWVYYSLHVNRMREIGGHVTRLVEENHSSTQVAVCMPEVCPDMETEA